MDPKASLLPTTPQRPTYVIGCVYFFMVIALNTRKEEELWVGRPLAWVGHIFKWVGRLPEWV